jgi:hypothetical protein
MLFMNLKEGRWNIRSWRAIFIEGVPMAAAIAMLPLPCGPVCVHLTGSKPGENGMHSLNREGIF